MSEQSTADYMREVECMAATAAETPLAPLSTEEMDLLRRLDGPPPLVDVTISCAVHPLAIRAVLEIEALRARVAELESGVRAIAEICHDLGDDVDGYAIARRLNALAG